MSRRTRGGAGRFLRAASVMGSWTLLSRVLGYLRDSINAALFGAGWVADAFFVAYRIPNMLRDLVGEGALSAAVIPSVTRALADRGRADASRLVSALLTWVVLGGAAVVAVGYATAPVIVRVMAPGFVSSPAQFDLTVSLTRWLFPFIVFISLGAAVMGWLNARGRFGPSAFAPAALNACVIAGGILCFVYGSTPERQVYGWTLAVLAGGMVQWLAQVPAARATGFAYAPRLRHPRLKPVLVLMGPALAGYAFTQVHLLVNTILASLLPDGSVARLYYGNRLMQLPLGVVGVALSVAAYPAVARALASGRLGDAARSVNRALRFTAFAVFPAAAGLIALAPWINGLLFRFGRFTSADAAVTASICAVYATGLIGHAVIRVLTPAFYAAGRPSVPVAIAGAGVVANILLSTVLMLAVGVVGLPLATSLVTLVSAVWLARRLRALVPAAGGRAVGGAFARSLLCAVAMGALVRAAAGWAGAGLASAGCPEKLAEASVTAGGIVLGVAAYWACAGALRIPERAELLAAWSERR